MNKTNNSKLKAFSQSLRKAMTKEEKHLWYDFLKDLPQTVNRQKIIGEYIVDFYCASAMLVIELDGTQHGTEENRKADNERDSYLNSLGINVLRYSNAEIHNNFRNVCLDILKHINKQA